MWLVTVYVLTLVVGESVVIALGLLLDRTYPAASLPVSLSLFFIVFWAGWVLSVRLTAPDKAKKRDADIAAA